MGKLVAVVDRERVRGVRTDPLEEGIFRHFNKCIKPASGFEHLLLDGSLMGPLV